MFVKFNLSMTHKWVSKLNIYLSNSQRHSSVLPDLHSEYLLTGNPLYCTHIRKNYANIQICRNIWTNAFQVSSAHTCIRIKWIKTCGRTELNENIIENIILSVIIVTFQWNIVNCPTGIQQKHFFCINIHKGIVYPQRTKNTKLLYLLIDSCKHLTAVYIYMWSYVCVCARIYTWMARWIQTQISIFRHLTLHLDSILRWSYYKSIF